MANTFHVVLANVSNTFFDGEAVSLTVPGTAGEMTVLANHEPFVTTLKSGIAKIKTLENVQDFPIENGVLECSGNRAVVLL